MRENFAGYICPFGLQFCSLLVNFYFLNMSPLRLSCLARFRSGPAAVRAKTWMHSYQRLSITMSVGGLGVPEVDS